MLTKSSPSRSALVVPTSNPADSFLGGRGSDDANPSATTLFNDFGGEHVSYSDSKPYSQPLESPSFPPLGGDPNLNNSFGTDLETQADISGPEVAEKHGCRTTNNTAKYRSMMPSKLPIPSSNPYFTIPPGLSPATLLESPVLFSGGLADPSPTTGSFPFLPSRNQKELLAATRNDKPKDNTSEQSDNFNFKPHPVVVKDEVTPISEHDQIQFQLSSQPPITTTLSASTSTMFTNLKSEPHHQSPTHQPLNEPPAKAPASHMPIVMNHPFSYRERPTADGYNWKKYGQKQLKGSEFPRSYYKCTYPNCTVKKQVECSHEGEITEIMYKGDHNHPKPQSTRRMSRSSVHTLERTHQESNGEVASMTGRLDSDRISGDVSTSSLVVSHAGLGGTPEQSFCSPSDEDNEASKVEEDDDEDEQDSKRRKSEEGKEMVANMPIRTIREPRVVVQTMSEIDILDDGYRWRKYGQKVVKGNLYPRSYYKCTNVGCIVRKHVERCSSDPKSVITTYEGKHNHNVPPARGEVIQEANASAPSLHATSGTDMYSRPPMMLGTRHGSVSMEDETRVTTSGNQTFNDNASIMDYTRNISGGSHPNLMPGQSFSGIGSFGAYEPPPNWELRLPQHFYQSNSSPFVADQSLSRP